MGLTAFLSLAVTGACFLLLLKTRLAPDVVLFGRLVCLLTVGVLTPTQALAGFANEGLLTIAMMFVVATGLRETGGVDLRCHRPGRK